MDELLADFIADASEGLAQIEADLARLMSEGVSGETVLRIVRAFHKIKGACGFLKLARTEALCHACEGALMKWRDGRGPVNAPALAQAAVRKIEEIVALIATAGAEPAGEDADLLMALGAAPNALDWAVELAHVRDRLLARASAALNPLQRLGAAAAAMEPPPRAKIETAWRGLPAMVEDLGVSLGKPLKLTLEGGDLEIAGAAIGPLREALGHLVRNCADHGVEPPAERRARRKPKYGQIQISATRADHGVTIRVSDDGRGLDTARIRHRAISRGMVFAAHAARMEPDQIHAFIFAPAFSTAETVTTVSGRGVGLDAARAAMEALGGTIGVTSQARRGAAFTLTIPDAAAPAASGPARPIADVA